MTENKSRTHSKGVNDLKISRWALLAALVISVLGFMVYSNALENPFIWDDLQLVKENPRIRDWTYIGTLFKEDIAAIGIKTSSYRPFQILTYLLDHAVWKLNPLGYHLTNIILHVAVALCLGGLWWFLFKDPLLAFLGSVLFLVHPVHNEAVAYISGRADPLAACFMLICLTTYTHFLETRNRFSFTCSLGAFLCALLSKEYALILPALLAVYHVAFRRRPDLKSLTPFLVPMVLYLLWRQFQNLGSWNVHSHIETTFAERLPGAFAALTAYLRLLILPVDLHMGYGQTLFDFHDPKVLVGIVLLLSLVSAAWRWRNRNPLVCFALLWFLVALLPVSNLFPINATMAEHWLYLPSAGFFLVLAWILRNLFARSSTKALGAVLILGIITLWSFLSIRQNEYWKDPVEFYRRILRYNPLLFRAHNNLGALLAQEGNAQEAIQHYTEALKIDSTYEETHYNLGTLLSRNGKHDEAVQHYLEALRLRPQYAKAHNNLANTYAKTGRHKEAIHHYSEALKINPAHVNAHCNLGVLYTQLGKTAEAMRCYWDALEIDPHNPQALNGLGAVYLKQGNHTKAEALFLQVLSHDPANAAARDNLRLLRTSTPPPRTESGGE